MNKRHSIIAVLSLAAMLGTVGTGAFLDWRKRVEYVEGAGERIAALTGHLAKVRDGVLPVTEANVDGFRLGNRTVSMTGSVHEGELFVTVSPIEYRECLAIQETLGRGNGKTPDVAAVAVNVTLPFTTHRFRPGYCDEDIRQVAFTGTAYEADAPRATNVVTFNMGAVRQR